MDNPDTCKTRVILVEDQELTRMGIKVALERSAQVEIVGEAGDGLSAVDLAGKVAHDVILMDIGLPFLNGIDASIKIRELYPNSKCLMLTSHKEANHVFAALNAGARGYSQKSVSIARLLTAIKAIQQGDIWLDPEIAEVIFANMNNTLKTAPAVEEQVQIASGRDIQEREEREQSRKSSKGPGPREDLTDRELEVLNLVVAGLRNTEIADKLCISVDTVKSHMSHIIDKLAVSDRTQAALKALRAGLVFL